MLGLGARNENAWIDGDFDRPERCGPLDVLKRLVAPPSLDEAVEAVHLGGIQFDPENQVGPVPPRGRDEQPPDLVIGKVRDRAEKVGGEHEYQ